MFEKVDIPIIGLVENMAVFICPDCDGAHHIFGKDGAKREAEKMGVPYLGAAPLDMAIREGGDAGIPAAAGDNKVAENFAKMAKAIL
jgi:ATP-binding protein involved in chromosome partitioning